MNKEALSKIINSGAKDLKEFMVVKRRVAKEYGISIPENSRLLEYYRSELQAGRTEENPVLLAMLKKRAVRTMSGIAPVAVLTKPYDCPGNCAFCPSEDEVPQSYLSNEPAVMRAIRCNYNPYIQVHDRLRALIANGHEPTKIELIVIGGTWSYFPRKYKLWYIANLFKAANDFSFVISSRSLSSASEKAEGKGISIDDKDKIKNQKSKIKNDNNHPDQIPLSTKISDLETILKKEQRRNEKAKYQIIGLTLETRPDYINEKELWEMRELGCTRVEVGVQMIDDKVLSKNNRGHGVREIAEASKMLREFGFKITYHLMPGLPGATPALDLKRFKQLFEDERFEPDQIKFYPTVVTKGSLMYKWWQEGKFKPYSEKQLRKLIIDCKKHIPEYVRVIRLIRDIPGESIEAGNKVTNLRQVMQQEGLKCSCIRCREVKGQKTENRRQTTDVIEYKAAGGDEFFVQVVDDKRTLYGFCRLFVKNDIAIVRELHVYGQLVPIGGEKKVQHAGLGRKLLEKAEQIAKKENCDNIKVISGVGVRGYYRKNGYKLKNTYMTKKL